VSFDPGGYRTERYGADVIVGLAQGVVVVAVGAVLGAAVAGLAGAAVGVVLSAWPAWRYSVLVGRCRPYPTGSRGGALAVVDGTWGALNTWAAALFVTVLTARRNVELADRSRASGLVHLRDPAIPGYATTIGMVTAGCSPRIEPHERVHVLQARILGPLYLPLVGLGFVIATVVPYWLLSSASRRRVRDVRSYFVRGVYPNTWHEWWAYRQAPAT
jgi:hypothetical protein